MRTENTHPVQHFVRQMLASYGFQISVLALTFVASILVARILGPEGRGIYAWFLTLHGVMASVVLLGFDTVLRKQGTKPPAEQGAWFYTACLTGILVLAVLFVPVYWGILSTELGSRYPQYVLFSLGAVAATHVMSCALMMLTAQNRVWLYNMLGILPRIVGFILIMLCVWWGALTVKSTLLAYLVPNFFVVGLLVWILHKNKGFIAKIKPKFVWENWRFMGASYLAFLALLLLLKVDQILLGLYGFTAELGHYSVAVSLIDTLQIGPMLAGTFLLPRLQSLSKEARWGFYVKILLLLAGGMAAVAAVGAMLAPWVVPLLFGAEYLASVPLLQVLLAALVCLSCFTITQHALASYTEGWRLILAPSIAFGLNLVLNVLWIPTHGAMGAAVASVLAYALGLAVVLTLIYGRRHHHIA